MTGGTRGVDTFTVQHEEKVREIRSPIGEEKKRSR